MATCLKRSSSLRELICPVCRTILREPVTLPCTHNLCLRCLQGTVQHNSLTCPLCRQRLGSWLRTATKSENLVNAELWQLIRRSFPRELDQAAAATASAASSSSGHSGADFDAGFIPKNILSAAGDIRKEYEVQMHLAQAEVRRQQEKERLAGEVLIRQLQEDEERGKLLLMAQDQLLAKTLAKRECTNKNATTVNVDKPNQSKSTNNQKMSLKKQNVAPISKIRSERYLLNAKTNPANVQKEPLDTFGSQKPVPIHNVVTRVVTHQSRVNQPNNSTYSAALGELIGSTSKIYGLQSKEELQVPSDVLSSKKKKLGVEVCVTNIEGEERIGSAESAGSHDSINQEIHHFKPIKALPRTPLKLTDGKQYDPKLIRVLATYKKITNAVPKPPVQTHSKKIFGCSWSAFKRISKLQVLQKEPVNIHQETKKTDKSLEPSRTAVKSLSKFASEVDDTTKRRRNTETAFDNNDNYTKKIVNGTKVSKKLNMDEETELKPRRRAVKVKNGLISGKHKAIEVIEIEDDDTHNPPSVDSSSKTKTPDPLALTPKNDTRHSSPLLETAVENIAERIKRRKSSRNVSNTENIQSAMNLVKPVSKPKNSKPAKKPSKPKSKKTNGTVSKSAGTKATKSKTKTPKTTTITSQIKRLAARSSKRPRYTEDSESEPEGSYESTVEQTQPEAVKQSEPEKPAAASPSPRKKPRKNAKPRRNKPKSPDDDSITKEQERLEKLAEQERKDRELALQLQAQFDSMQRTTLRTRRGVAKKPSSPPLTERRPQKRTVVE